MALYRRWRNNKRLRNDDNPHGMRAEQTWTKMHEGLGSSVKHEQVQSTETIIKIYIYFEEHDLRILNVLCQAMGNE